MRTSLFRRLTPFALVSLLLASSAGPARADEVIKTLPGGDGKALLDSPTDPDHGGGAIIRDEECAKKFGKGKLKNGKPDPEYARCVHDKIEKTKKKGEH